MEKYKNVLKYKISDFFMCKPPQNLKYSESKILILKVKGL